MDVKRVGTFFKLIEDTDISELCWEKADIKIRLRRSKDAAVSVHNISKGTSEPSSKCPTSNPNSQVSGENAGIFNILSKMVGTFYRSGGRSKPFVEEGDVIKKGQKLAVVEAMKIMKEVISECDGTIKKILIENGAAVEYGQPLFEISK